MSHPGFLERMREASRLRAARARESGPRELELERRARARPPAPRLVHDPASFDVIAEVKLRSPAEGTLAGSLDHTETLATVARQARTYEDAGAVAISVLTEPDEFRGSLEHLRAAAEAVSVPVLRKDFLVDRYQLLEARDHGAGGVLLIARILEGDLLETMVREALELDLFVLLEAFDETDLGRIADLTGRFPGDGEAGPLLVGLNCRDLSTLRVEPARFASLIDALPEGPGRVAESGILSASDAAHVAGLGYDLALVGSALMRAPDAGVALAELVRSGRAARAGIRSAADSGAEAVTRGRS